MPVTPDADPTLLGNRLKVACKLREVRHRHLHPGQAELSGDGERPGSRPEDGGSLRHLLRHLTPPTRATDDARSLDHRGDGLSDPLHRSNRLFQGARPS